MTWVGITVICQCCKVKQPIIEIEHIHLQRWRDGYKIQDAMPGLTPAERELLISATCEKCFDEMFKER